MLSSVLTSLDDLFDPFRSLGIGAGDELFGGVAERRDFLELRDGVRYGVSAGVGSDTTAGVLHSSSVSHAAMMAVGSPKSKLVRDWRAAQFSHFREQPEIP
jgi:hypothetical protein